MENAVHMENRSSSPTDWIELNSANIASQTQKKFNSSTLWIKMEFPAGDDYLKDLCKVFGVTMLRIEACKNLNAPAINLIDKSVTTLIIKDANIQKDINKSKTWHLFPLKINLDSLRILELNNCDLQQLDEIPAQLDTLSLTECCLKSNMVTENVWVTQRGLCSEYSKQVVKSVEKKFVFNLLKVKKVVISNCQNELFFQFDKEANQRIETLKVLNHRPRLGDHHFKNFPETLNSLEIVGCDLTDETLNKIPSAIQFLKLEDCPKLTIIAGRAQLLFPAAQITGLKNEPPKTQIIRKKLEESVLGQQQAIEAAFSSLCCALSGVAPENRPCGVFFFVGPSGVGKTELAKAVSIVGDRKLLRYDMAEYQQAHQAARLIGSPNGYVGCEQGGQLVNAIKDCPNAIVLFDEVEKAHIEVLKTLLGVFDYGKMTDGKGLTVDFTQTIIIMTSNLGAKQIAALDWTNLQIALEQARKIVVDLLIKQVAPEFASRIDNVIPFRPLDKEAMKEIMSSKMQQLKNTVEKKQGIKLDICSSVWETLLKTVDPSLGIRPVIRQSELEINAEIAQALLNSFIKKEDHVRIERIDGKIKLKLIRS